MPSDRAARLALVWWIPVAVFVVCFGGGALAAARWLPDLAPGPIGGLAFFLVCGLLGAALALLGLHVYGTVRLIEATSGSSVFESHGEALASGLTSILFESGMISGIAAVTYLLAPRDPASAHARRDPPGP
jgi:hypothetical protein